MLPKIFTCIQLRLIRGLIFDLVETLPIAFGVEGFNTVSLKTGLGGVRDVAFAIITQDQLNKPSLLFSIIGCAFLKDFPFRLLRAHN